LALAPLIAEDLIERTAIIVDAKSGVSVAGRSPKLKYHFPECNESLAPYNVGLHRQTPEIVQVLTTMTGGRGEPVEVIFTPHLVPMDRGVFATIHARPRQPAVEHDLLGLYRSFYARSPFGSSVLKCEAWDFSLFCRSLSFC
jgi:N-acetyl-gamma-glutamyl-phosphate reductase